MSEVSLTVGKSRYCVSCAPGEEEHVTRLGAMVNERIQRMEGRLSPQESQNLLFAALLLADELDELNKAQSAAGHEGEAETLRSRLEGLQAKTEELRLERDALRAERDRLASELSSIEKHEAANASNEDTLAARLEKLAAALEKRAEALEAARMTT